MTPSPPRTRFAPSPTGDLHLGGAWTALASWALARRCGGTFLLRIEDIDTPRVVADSERRIEEDLQWLGLFWDRAPVRQSERTTLYERAIAQLEAGGFVYPCDCSRTEIAGASRAPHPGEETRETVYPGTCRDRDPQRRMKRPPAIRFRVADEVVRFDDEIAGPFSQNLSEDVGDFVLRRGDGLFAYQLAVVVDDLSMGITQVVRGADLTASTPRQIALARALGAAPPAYAHVPLVVATDGARLEKRTRGAAVRDLRARGVDPKRIIGALALGLGFVHDGSPVTPDDVARAVSGVAIAWRRDPWPIPAW